MILEYEVIYTFTEVSCDKQHLERVTNKMHIKGKSEAIIREKALYLIAELHGCNYESIVIDDMLYFDEYGDD